MAGISPFIWLIVQAANPVCSSRFFASICQRGPSATEATVNEAVFGRYRQIATIRAADVGTYGQARDTVIARDGALDPPSTELSEPDTVPIHTAGCLSVRLRFSDARHQQKRPASRARSRRVEEPAARCATALTPDRTVAGARARQSPSRPGRHTTVQGHR